MINSSRYFRDLIKYLKNNFGQIMLKRILWKSSALPKTNLFGFSPAFHFSSSLNNFSHLSDFLLQTSKISSRNAIIQQLTTFLVPYFKQNEYQVQFLLILDLIPS